jgi:hypothetical protein
VLGQDGMAWHKLNTLSLSPLNHESHSPPPSLLHPPTVDAAAAFAAGWEPGRGRSIFKLLRFHVKKNRAQVEALFPVGQELDSTQVRGRRRRLGRRGGEKLEVGRR